MNKLKLFAGKILFIIFMSFFLLGWVSETSANECGSDNECYNSYIQYELNSSFETICFSNYYYNNRSYKLYMPCTRQEFIRLEFAVATGELNDKDNYWFKLVWLNALLINKWLEPLYY